MKRSLRQRNSLVSALVAVAMATVAVPGLAGCDTSSGDPTAASTPVPALSDPEADSPTPATSATVHRPIKLATADQFIQPFVGRWHTKVTVTQTATMLARQSTTDYSAGHGTLELYVVQLGKGETPDAIVAACILHDTSGSGEPVRRTTTLVRGMLSSCYGATLTATQASAVARWVSQLDAATAGNTTKDFGDFGVEVKAAGATVLINLLAS